MTLPPSPWPDGFERWIPDSEWVAAEVGELARKYDSVENHGWYRNLEPTIRDLVPLLGDDALWLDYSGGTGILVDRLAHELPDRRFGALLVDASPRFLRLALEKLRSDPRVAFRWLRYRSGEKRLERLDEVLPGWLIRRGFEVLTSTNAIHLYYQMEATLRSWFEVVRPGGVVLVQSGNIDNPDAPAGTWVIDETVERLQPLARKLVREDPKLAPLRVGLDDRQRQAAYDRLRRKFFLPIRPLAYYLDKLREAGFEIAAVEALPIEASVAEWRDFLAAYHEGVLGWAGGSARIEGTDPAPEVVALRQELLDRALHALFEGGDDFRACWTYVRCRRP
ncbi:MAG TPA: class I SAM-dependent methyltransferase [Thermoanaerobaculia bacterium]|nr:class I SAM-dependent methyltransferase [Thermoanaerobaculia bacterium]